MVSLIRKKRIRLVGVLVVAFCALALLWAADDKPAGNQTNKDADDKPAAKQTKQMNQAEAKQAIQKYLTKKTGRPPRGIGTPAKTPWVWCAEQYAANEKNPKAVYFLIGAHLLLADSKYLNSKDAAERRKGLGMVLEACQTATNALKDSWLAVEICETYIRPHLTDADRVTWNFTSEQNVFEVMVDAYAEAHDPDKMIEIFRLMIQKAQHRNTADGARLRLSQVLEGVGALQEAIACLKAIDDKAGLAGAKRRIPELEQKLAEKKQKENRK